VSACRVGRQSGQAIVLIALIMVVLLGFLGLAIDGGGAYLDRRSMQGAVDAAALAAAYNYMNTSDYSQAQQAATDTYAKNELLYTTPSCTGYGTLSASCNFADSTGQVLVIDVVDRSIAGVTFNATGRHRVPVTLMQVVGAGTSVPVSAIATAVARHAGTGGAAIQTLSPAGCGGGAGGDSLRVSGTSDTIVTGDIWSNGDINQTGSAAAQVAGNVVDICPAIPPTINGITLVCNDPARSTPPCPTGYSTGVETNGWVQPDPGYAAPTLNTTGRTWASTTVNALPGTYSADPRLTGGAGCFFLAAGTYTWQAGFTQQGGLVSNELRPPDEPVYNDNKTKATVQFWNANGVRCGGSFQPYPTNADSSNTAVTSQTWGVEITAVRWEPNGGVSSCSGPDSLQCFLRESAPSMCRLVDVGGGQNFKVWISNVPGAMAYNVYVDSSGTCNGPSGYVTQFNNSATEGNQSVSNCAPTLARNQAPPNPFNNCDLGSSSVTINGNGLPGTWAPNFAAHPDTSGAYPPDGERAPLGSGLPNADPAAAAPPNGDRANENYCVDSSGVVVSCPGTYSPGAVLFYIPGGSSTTCLTLNGGGDIYMYSGRQFARILLFEPGPLQSSTPNTCQNKVNGHGLTSLIGIFYVPAADTTITGNSGYMATIAGGVITWTATINGAGNVAITADPTLPSWPSAVHLTQ